MELLLIKEKLWNVMKTIKPEVPPTGATAVQTKAADDWQDSDDIARATIGLMVDDDQLTHIRTKTKAKGVWDALREFHEKNTLGNKVMLMRRICNMKLV